LPLQQPPIGFPKLCVFIAYAREFTDIADDVRYDTRWFGHNPQNWCQRVCDGDARTLYKYGIGLTDQHESKGESNKRQKRKSLQQRF
jgi:hypothetical protein